MASDASAIVEHTKRVLYLEDGDLAFFREEGLTISHGIKRDDNISSIRAIQTLEIELEKIMKGDFILYYSSFLCVPSFINLCFQQETMNTSCKRKSLSSPRVSRTP